jgi:biotin carboxyl carrier protein
MKLSAQVGEHVYEVVVTREDGRYIVEVDGERNDVDAQKLEGDFYSILTGNRSYEVSVEARRDGYDVRHGAAQQRVIFTDPGRRARQGETADGPLEILSQMPGRVVRVLVAEGDTVEEGQGILIVEAMKMENEITTEKAGKVTKIAVEPGQTVENDALLAVVE